MSTEQKTRIIDTWQGEQQGDTERATEVVGSADTMPDAFSESAQAALPSTLNAPPASRWPGRLVRLALAAGLGGAVLQWGQWSWAAWQWQQLQHSEWQQEGGDVAAGAAKFPAGQTHSGNE